MRLRERPEKRGGKVEECLEVQTNEESHKETKGGARKGGRDTNWCTLWESNKFQPPQKCTILTTHDAGALQNNLQTFHRHNENEQK
jgi:hypothetical protein